MLLWLQKQHCRMLQQNKTEKLSAEQMSVIQITDGNALCDWRSMQPIRGQDGFREGGAEFSK